VSPTFTDFVELPAITATKFDGKTETATSAVARREDRSDFTVSVITYWVLALSEYGSNLNTVGFWELERSAVLSTDEPSIVETTVTVHTNSKLAYDLTPSHASV
jgi:hypothetical protein